MRFRTGNESRRQGPAGKDGKRFPGGWEESGSRLRNGLHRQRHWSKLIELYAKEPCISRYINYSSIKKSYIISNYIPNKFHLDSRANKLANKILGNCTGEYFYNLEVEVFLNTVQNQKSQDRFYHIKI